jgi:hypothetical protein
MPLAMRKALGEEERAFHFTKDTPQKIGLFLKPIPLTTETATSKATIFLIRIIH